MESPRRSPRPLEVVAAEEIQALTRIFRESQSADIQVPPAYIDRLDMLAETLMNSCMPARATATVRFEVDLMMLKGTIAQATASDLEPFCRALEAEVNAEDGLVSIVATFHASNDPTDSGLIAWGWPTEAQWRRAIEIVFDVKVLP